MRKFLIAAAVATSALTVAAPAAAQYAPPYGNAYGYNNYGQVRALQVRIDRLQREIRQLDRRNIISNREAHNLMNDARAVEHRLRETARRGLSHSERRAVEVRIARLERQIWRDAHDGRRFSDRRYSDRDRDGRNDRYEDDRGWDHD